MYLEHINMTVSDLERSIAFYTALFGLRVRWRRGPEAEGGPAAHVGDDRFYIAMFQATDDAAGVTDYDRVGLNHVGFVVDDLDATRRKVESLGCRIHHEADYEPGRRAYFFDPDGIEIELVEYAEADLEAGKPETVGSTS